MLESQLGFVVGDTHTMPFSFSRCTWGFLTFKFFGLACSIREVQRALFSALTGLASPLIAKPSMALSDLGATNSELAVSTLWYVSQFAKLDHISFRVGWEPDLSNNAGPTIGLVDSQSLYNTQWCEEVDCGWSWSTVLIICLVKSSHPRAHDVSRYHSWSFGLCRPYSTSYHWQDLALPMGNKTPIEHYGRTRKTASWWSRDHRAMAPACDYSFQICSKWVCISCETSWFWLATNSTKRIQLCNSMNRKFLPRKNSCSSPRALHGPLREWEAGRVEVWCLNRWMGTPSLEFLDMNGFTYRHTQVEMKTASWGDT